MEEDAGVASIEKKGISTGAFVVGGPRRIIFLLETQSGVTESRGAYWSAIIYTPPKQGYTEAGCGGTR